MNYSFYGGQRGTSFIISASYRYIKSADIKIKERELFIDPQIGADKPYHSFQEWVIENCMKEAFERGSDYTKVNYDEYVIIDSFDKDDKNNGKVFRRGYDYSNENGGGEYVGQIVGPSGKAPSIELTQYDDVKDIEGSRYAKGTYSRAEGLIPGKDGDTYNDVIQWASCALEDDAQHNNTVAYVGFKIPYLVVDYTAKSIDPYSDPSVVRKDDGQHPYYEQWELSIPRSKKSDGIDNFAVDEEGKLTYEHTDYTESAQGDTIVKTVSGYKQIQKFTINSENYHLLALYSDKAGSITYDGIAGWVDLGQVKDYDGILVGTNYSCSELGAYDIEGIIAKLLEKYPNGYDGRVITVYKEAQGEEEEKNKMFFGYDYDKNTWYCIGSLIDTPSVVVGMLTNEETQRTAAALPIGSIWFVTEEV